MWFLHYQRVSEVHSEDAHGKRPRLVSAVAFGKAKGDGSAPSGLSLQ